MRTSDRRVIFLGLFLTFATQGLADGQEQGVGIPRATPEMLRPPQTHPATEFQAEGLEAVYYDAMPWKGKPTRAFAWIGVPKLAPGQKAPGIVLVHGGGGTAFEAWVRLWVDRGYAAIAMDTCGTVPKGSYGKWERHEHGGPPGNRFDGSDEPVEDQWVYHAVADVILAHSLLRARPEVDADRVGVTGISWGGFLTCITSGLDDRFKFAVPVYGCGFLGENSTWIGEITAQGERGKRWLALWDPSHYLPHGKIPKLWVTGTNDFAYPMDSLQKSYRIAGGPSTLCIRPRMPHGHGGAGENPEEIRIFADAILKDGKPLASIKRVSRMDSHVEAEFQSETPIVKATLLFTRDAGPWTDRRWESRDASLDAPSNRATAELPQGTTTYYLNLEDASANIVSTEHATID